MEKMEIAQKITFTNEPKLSEHEAQSKFNERRISLAPLVKNFISTHDRFNNKEVSVTFAHACATAKARAARGRVKLRRAIFRYGVEWSQWPEIEQNFIGIKFFETHRFQYFRLGKTSVFPTPFPFKSVILEPMAGFEPATYSFICTPIS